MIERFRALLDRPLDPATARAASVITFAIGIGFAIVLAVAGVDHGAVTNTGPAAPTAHPRSASGVPRIAPAAELPAQDPQDRLGTAAHRRAARELAEHRALQHVPWRWGQVSVELIGAKGRMAVLAVDGPSLAVARRGWGRFLRRYRDDGRSYLARFRATRRGRR